MSRKTISLLTTLAVVIIVTILRLTNGHTSPLAATPFAGTQQFHVVPSTPLTLVTMPDDAASTVLSQISHASKSIDLVIYELSDPAIEQALIEKHTQGVSIRVLLNGGYYGSHTMNASAFRTLSDAGVPVKYTPATFALTHQKTLVTDASTALIMTFNLVPKYYKTGRDFGIIDSDASDVSAIERTFDADWNGTKINAQTGDSLVWSPGAKEVLVGMIDSAKQSLLVYNEEMQDSDVVAALERAADRNVSVSIVMTDANNWHAAFTDLTAHGVHIRTYAPKASRYIHAKMILTDGSEAFLGSENFSTNSLDRNRELGLLIANPAILQALETTFAADSSVASPFE